MLWLQIFALFLFALYLAVLRPRRGGKDAPPMVLSSPVFPIPVIGVILEFFKSPNEMVKRCYRDYGPVFTIPVRNMECVVILYYYFFLFLCFWLYGEWLNGWILGGETTHLPYFSIFIDLFPPFLAGDHGTSFYLIHVINHSVDCHNFLRISVLVYQPKSLNATRLCTYNNFLFSTSNHPATNTPPTFYSNRSFSSAWPFWLDPKPNPSFSRPTTISSPNKASTILWNPSLDLRSFTMPPKRNVKFNFKRWPMD